MPDLVWSQNPPTTDGFYLRVNAGHRIQRHVVVDGYVDWGWSGEEAAIPISSEKVKGYTGHSWWWLGPMPFPPEESGVGAFHFTETFRQRVDNA